MSFDISPDRQVVELKPKTPLFPQVLPAVLSLLFLASFISLALKHTGDTRGTMDIMIYEDIAERADGVFQGARTRAESEYPPLATVLFWTAHHARFNFDFAASWTALIVVSVVFAFAYLRCFGSRDALLFSAVLPLSVLLLGHEMIFGRYDIFVVLALILGVVAHKHRSFTESGFWLVFALSLKIVPILAVPVLFLTTPRRQWGALCAGAALGLLLAGVLSVGILGFAGTFDNIQYMTQYHAGRPIQLESFWSGISMLHALLTNSVVHTGFNHMSLTNADLGPGFVTLSKVLILSGVAFITYRAWKKEVHDFGILLSIVLVWALCFSPVLSPQYFTWIVPLLFLLLAERILTGRLTARCTVAILLTAAVAWTTKWVFPTHYGELIGQHRDAILMLNLRNILLLILAHVLLTDTGLVPVKVSAPSRPKAGSFLIDTALVAVAAVLFLGVRPMILTTLTNSAVRVDDEVRSVERLPVSVHGKANTVVVATTLNISALSQQRYFRVRPDDCIQTIVINGTALPQETVQFCDGSGPGQVFDFGEYLEQGPNSIVLLVQNNGGPMGADVIPLATPLLRLLLGIVLLTVIWYVLQCWKFVLVLRSRLPAYTAKMLYTLAALCSRSPSSGRLFFRNWPSPRATASI